MLDDILIQMILFTVGLFFYSRQLNKPSSLKIVVFRFLSVLMWTSSLNIFTAIFELSQTAYGVLFFPLIAHWIYFQVSGKLIPGKKKDSMEEKQEKGGKVYKPKK